MSVSRPIVAASDDSGRHLQLKTKPLSHESDSVLENRTQQYFLIFQFIVADKITDTK